MDGQFFPRQPVQFEGRGVPSLGDPNFASVSLLLHMDGADGSTTFTDNSSSPKTVTAVGNAQIDTAQSKFGGASGLFDGNGDYASAAANAAFNFGSGAFTVEFFLRTTQTDQTWAVGYSGGSSQWAFRYNFGASGRLELYHATTGLLIQASGTGFNDGNWHHIAITRSGNSVRMFLDGVQQGATFTATSETFGNSTNAFVVGLATGFGGASEAVNGWIDEVRVTKGVARYTAGFTPPASAFPNS